MLAGETSSYLVDGGAHGALEEHLQHLGVGLFPVRGHGQFPGLLLHVLDGHLDGRQVKLRERKRFSCHWSFHFGHRTLFYQLSLMLELILAKGVL